MLSRREIRIECLGGHIPLGCMTFGVGRYRSDMPLMTKSLISFCVLDSKGYHFQVKGGLIYVYRGSEVVLRGRRYETLYLLSGFTITGYDFVSSSLVRKNDMTKLGDMRLSHVSEKGM